ncbi:hypothetical protein niasHT_039557 [Heterodera trifolii]|uniref:Zinc transporter ZIP14 n=1 Tax=Heterodera trifolii TaxID=157864 RepID=A0ABD2ICX4_9BILA
MSGIKFFSAETFNATATNDSISKASTKPSQAEVWIFGLSFVTVIGLCALFGILLMRCLKKSLFNRFITFFVSVGVGSLSGSAVFSLLPHAFGLHGKPVYLSASFAAVVGIYIFFFCDKFIKIVLEMRKRSIKKRAEMKQQMQLNNNLHNHNKGECCGGAEKENGHLPTDALLHQNGGNCNNDQKRTTTTAIAMATGENSKEQKESERSIELQSHALCVHDHEYKEGDSVIATVAWMIIFGDGLHNFLDGLIIGTSFTESLLRGISVSVAVLCEEFPHELGDVAILVNAGMSMKQALVYNLLSALTCYLGFILGVFVGNLSGTSFSLYTHGFAGGMFLYISLACMMPEMKNAMEKALTVSLSQGLEVLALQAFGVVTGLSCMFVMARFGDAIQFT